jgi:hypothetical protein
MDTDTGTDTIITTTITTTITTGTIITTTMAATTSTEDAVQAKLLAWLSPAYPIGAFSYSHGLEMAVEDGAVTRRADLVAYVEAALLHGAGAVDAGLLALAWRAAAGGEDAALDDIDLRQPSNVVPIGPGCRVCPRQDCVQRAFPPARSALRTAHG